MTLRVQPNTDILVWARKDAGLTIDDAAHKIGTTVERLQEWEQGESLPTARQLRMIGKAYRRPSAFFYLPEPPPAPPELADYRSLPAGIDVSSPVLLYEVRRARARRIIALDLYDDLEVDVPEFKVTGSLRESSDRLAEHIRDALDVPLETQFGWRDQYKALRSWIHAIENAGILVSQFSGVEVAEARGFSLSDRPLPLIAVNGSDTPRGRIFTLIHEVTHIAAHLGGLCDLHESPSSERHVEPFCNRVAAEVLVPTQAISLEEIVVTQDSLEWSDASLQHLANRFMVSREVILRKLLTLRLTTREFYEQKRDEFIEQYRRSRRSGFIEYPQRVLRDNGTAYTTLVIMAFHNDVITARDMSHYLGDVKLKHVDSIATQLGLV